MRGMDVERGFTASQRAGLEARAADHDRTLAAMHDLEAALAAPAPGREGPWRDAVSAALAVLDDVTAAEFENAQSPDSLLSDVKRTQPRLRTRVRGLWTQYRHLRDAIPSLRNEIDDVDNGVADFADLRQRLAWLLTALRHQRARESDLLYEAYFDAFNAELSDQSD
jgi:hypothetical protein